MVSRIGTKRLHHLSHIGRFLRGVLRDLAGWFKDEAAYSTDSKRNLSSLPGFTVRLSDSSVMSWTDYKRFVKKVHNKIASVSIHLTSDAYLTLFQAMVACITGSHGEFMHVSNAIIVLKEILPVFPLGIINSNTGRFLDDALQKLLANEKRGDIKILATSYQGQLRMAKKEWETTTEQPVIGDVRLHSSLYTFLTVSLAQIVHKSEWGSCWPQKFSHAQSLQCTTSEAPSSAVCIEYTNYSPVTRKSCTLTTHR
jgi:hypothetical protein